MLIKQNRPRAANYFKGQRRPVGNFAATNFNRNTEALMAIYDNTGKDKKLALRIHKAVKKQAMSGFRDNQVVVMRIKRALFGILGDDSEVERIYKIIEKKEKLQYSK